MPPTRGSRRSTGSRTFCVRPHRWAPTRCGSESLARSTKRKGRRSPPRRRGRGAAPPRRRWLRRVLLWGGLVALLGGGLYLFWLDLWVQREFDGRRWALPARVYARPLELYAGAPISLGQLTDELNRLGYLRQHPADRPGTYSVSEAQVVVHRRPFRFWDGAETALSAQVRFDAAGVAALGAGGGRALDLLRLDAALIGSFYPATDEDRVLLRLDEVPPLLIEALIAVEDRSYWTHAGISPRGIARALLADIRAGRAVQGGSTLTQQLVKNFFLTPERSISRKLKEAVMALLLERHYSKEEILETYLNEVFLGQVGRRAVHGFAQASWLYFGRPLQELGTAQLALLAGMVKAPSAYNPRRYPEQAAARRDLVLDIMVREQILDTASAEHAKAQPLGVADTTPVGANRYPAFLDLVRRQLRRDYPDDVLREEGLRLFTTLDTEAQAELEQTLGDDRYFSSGQLQAAAVVAQVATGEVVALAGGRHARAGGFNRALDALRPVGSLVKPAVYLAALEQPERFHLGTVLPDEPLQVPLDNGDVWIPQNADERFRGAVPLVDGLVHSLNIPTVNLGLAVGTEQVADTLRRLGVARRIQTHPSLLLGALELSPVEVTQAYLTLAGSGFHTPLRAIRSVTDHAGEPVNRYPLRVQQTVAPAPAFLINTALREVVVRGTARSLAGRFPAHLGIAGKTGTSDDTRDAWFAGYDGNLVAVVWVGRDDNAPTGLHGASGALPLWAAFMVRQQLQPLVLPQPEQIVWVRAAADTPAVAGGTRHCLGDPALPVVAQYVPVGLLPCGQSESGGAVTRPLRWLRNLFD